MSKQKTTLQIKRRNKSLVRAHVEQDHRRESGEFWVVSAESQVDAHEHALEYLAENKADAGEVDTNTAGFSILKLLERSMSKKWSLSLTRRRSRRNMFASAA